MTLPPARGSYKAVTSFPQADVMRAPLPVGTAGVFSRTAKGETSYTTAGSFNFVVPANVRAISAVCIGAGGAAASAGGCGGGLAWRNRIRVTPGETLTVVINTTSSVIRRGSEILCGATAGGTLAVGPGRPIVGQGGAGGLPSSTGGGGAGGYMGDGGATSQGMAGGGGGGGGTTASRSGGGGGVGLTGLTASYTVSTGGSSAQGGGAGVGGTAGSAGFCNGCVCPPTTCWTGGTGGNYGGGAGFGSGTNGSAAGGAVRIIWPGETRTFPYNAA